MVQLKATLCCTCPESYRGFNSKMVQLKVQMANQPPSAQVRFNSKMVQLKGCADGFESWRYWRFNSKMVQLKVAVNVEMWRPDIGFNSKMVQLKGWCWWSSWPQSWFQFQNGTIKSSCSAIIPLQFHSFNSKMVQLKGWILHDGDLVYFRFNSKMVQLKAHHIYLPHLRTPVSIPKWYN